MEDRGKDRRAGVSEEIRVTAWHFQTVPFKYQLSDLTLFSLHLPLQMRSIALTESVEPSTDPAIPDEPLLAGSEGYWVRSLPVVGEVVALSSSASYVRYVTRQYRHCFIDLDQPFARYEAKFSAKTRSTIKRKIRKYGELSGGTIQWRLYRSPEDIREFLRLARPLSSKTYQERLLDAGLPTSADFDRKSEELAADDRLRAYILFHGDKAVSYLYCPVIDGVVTYAHLGYDPDFGNHSVGTVLQWLAVEQLFREGQFKFFDFTEGESEHKRLFATHERQCANVIWLRRSARNEAIVRSHLAIDGLSKRIGDALDRRGVKKRVKRLIRFGFQK
jgi:hypothetical protein